MLKIIYSETGLHLEILTVDRNDWITDRIQFATSIGERLTVSKTRAAFSLPQPIWKVEACLQMAGTNNVTVQPCDLDYVEVGLIGDWISTDRDSEEGIFIARLPDRVEFCLWELWQVAKEELVAYEW
jgi:hypothetical protein